MANVYAVKSGNWSDTTLWNTSALPTTADDVFAAGSTIYIDQNITVLTINTIGATGIGGGGTFIPNNGVTMTTNVVAGSTTCVTFQSAAPSICTLYGGLTGGSATNIYGFNNTSTGTAYIYGLESSGGTGSGAYGINNNTTGTIYVSATIRGRGAGGLNNNSTGSVFITGNIFASQPTANIIGLNNNGVCVIYGNVAGGPQLAGGGGGNAYGIINAASTSNLTVYGNISGANAVTGSGYGIFHAGTAIANIIGDVYSSVSPGIFNYGTGVVNITGNCYGGTVNGSPSITNNNFGILKIIGSAIGGSGTNAYGAYNNATGYLEVQGVAIGNAWGVGSSGINSAPGIFGSQTGTTIVRSLCCGARGQWPTAGNIRIVPQSTSTATLFTSASAAQVLFTSLSTNIVPPASSVRLGTRYNLNDYTGTCNIPSISSVLQGVSVDNSIGVAALQPQTIWNYSTLSATDVNSLGGRLANVATVQSIGQQLTALNL